jgi:hypothetical protein
MNRPLQLLTDIYLKEYEEALSPDWLFIYKGIRAARSFPCLELIDKASLISNSQTSIESHHLMASIDDLVAKYVL